MKKFTLVCLAVFLGFGLILPVLTIRAGEPAPVATEDTDAATPDAPALTARDIPTPLIRANVGDWVLYRQAKGGNLRMTVIEKWVGGKYATVVIELAETTRKKKRPRLSTEKIHVEEQAEEVRQIGPHDTVVPAEMFVAGRKLRAVIVNTVEGGEIVRQSYFSDEVPIYGLVRGVAIDKRTRTNVLSLEDFGFGEGDD